MRTHYFAFFGLILAGLFQLGCSTLAGGLLDPNDTATVIAKTAQIRTSYSVVAADDGRCVVGVKQPSGQGAAAKL